MAPGRGERKRGRQSHKATVCPVFYIGKEVIIM